MSATNAEVIAESIRRVLPKAKRGTLRIFGTWFGLPRDNVHSIVGANAEKDRVEIRFDDGEHIIVWEPADFRIDNMTFEIRHAARVQLEWYSYGLSHSPENLCRRDFLVQGDRVHVAQSGRVSQELTPTVNAAAVEII